MRLPLPGPWHFLSSQIFVTDVYTKPDFGHNEVSWVTCITRILALKAQCVSMIFSCEATQYPHLCVCVCVLSFEKFGICLWMTMYDYL